MTKRHRRDRFHEIALLVFGAGIGLGEGVALLGLGLILIACALRRESIDWQALTAGPMGIWLGPRQGEGRVRVSHPFPGRSLP